jgi:hypothetical protein
MLQFSESRVHLLTCTASTAKIAARNVAAQGRASPPCRSSSEISEISETRMASPSHGSPVGVAPMAGHGGRKRPAI